MRSAFVAVSFGDVLKQDGFDPTVAASPDLHAQVIGQPLSFAPPLVCYPDTAVQDVPPGGHPARCFPLVKLDMPAQPKPRVVATSSAGGLMAISTPQMLGILTTRPAVRDRHPAGVGESRAAHFHQRLRAFF
eukprot:SRR837773.13276.p2 GENE.SRR837773.13276~~SRR837773.13276.p2  ORF type:complete len:132 (-),score=10.55 SRR837773.13276:44-439(-)